LSHVLLFARSLKRFVSLNLRKVLPSHLAQFISTLVPSLQPRQMPSWKGTSEITISGLLVKDVGTSNVLNVQKTVLVHNKQDEGQAAIINDEMERLKEESSLLKTHFFSTKIEVPEDFLSTVVGGLTGKFKLHTITKMVREVKAAKRARAAVKRRRVSPSEK
jgi:hypothetical protein